MRAVERSSWRTRGSIVVVVVVVVAAIVLMREYDVRLYAQIALIIAAVFFLASIFLGEPDRYNVRKHAKLSMALTLGLTWSAGFVSAAVVTRVSKNEAWFATLLLSTSSIGGLFALQRSVRTRSETGAGLREISALRVASLSAPLVEQRVEALEVRTVDELIQVAVRMLRLAVSLPLTPNSHLVDKSALWLFDDKSQSWSVVASSSMDPTDNLTFPAIAAETSGGGIIPNLAVASAPSSRETYCKEGDVFLCTANVRSHPWFRPGGSGTVEGMMVVLLWQDDRLLGALSLTSRTPDAIPVSGSKSLELLEILNLWKRSFVVPLARLYAVRETSPT